MKENHYPPVKSLVVPLELGNLIVPGNLMVEMLMVEHIVEDGLVNWLEWHGKRIPLISLESMCLQDHNGDVKKQCIVLNSLMGNKELEYVAIQSKGSPHTVEVTEDTLRNDHKKNEERCPYIASHVRVGNIPCMIPDLPAIETAIVDALKRKAEMGT